MELLPLKDAVDRLSRKTPIGSVLKSAEWEQVPLALRERAQFSAGVTSARVLQTIQDRLLGQVKLQRENLENGKQATFDRSSFIDSVRDVARSEGIVAEPGKEGGLQDITSIPRLGLIYDMQNAQAAGYATWKLDQNEGALALWPAYRFGPSTARVPRKNWIERWARAGKEAGWEGASRSEMVALKTSAIWAALSRFGTPWPPFDWGSTRELEDVDREEAEALGLLKPGEVPSGGEEGFNERLQASVTGLGPEMTSRLGKWFGDQIEIADGTAFWRGADRPAATARQRVAIAEPLPPAPEWGVDEQIAQLGPIADEQDREQRAMDAVDLHLDELRRQYRQSEGAANRDEAKFARLRERIAGALARSEEQRGRLLKVIERAREAISVPAGKRASIELVGDGAGKVTLRAAQSGAEIVSRYVPSGVIGKSPIKVRNYQGRAHCAYDGTVNISGSTPPRVAAHEITHALEQRNPPLLEKAAKFLLKRTAGEPDERLRDLTGFSGFKPDEVARKDKWKERGGEHYCGKIYSMSGVGTARKAEDVRATELLSMGIERLDKNPVEFYRNDREYFEFVVRTLKG